MNLLINFYQKMESNKRSVENSCSDLNCSKRQKLDFRPEVAMVNPSNKELRNLCDNFQKERSVSERYRNEFYYNGVLCLSEGPIATRYMNEKYHKGFPIDKIYNIEAA